jgi:signal transduction histidine kinase
MLRVESRDFRLHLEIGEINDVIQDAWAQLAPLASAKQLQVTLELEPMFSMEFDRTLIREVLINILDNSIKYCPAGRRIHIRSSENAAHVRVEVTDSGPGIPALELDQIWGKFVRGKGQDMKTKGSGLGLYLVKFFIELHGGKVFIESELGQGTKIGFALPLALNQSPE